MKWSPEDELYWLFVKNTFKISVIYYFTDSKTSTTKCVQQLAVLFSAERSITQYVLVGLINSLSLLR